MNAEQLKEFIELCQRPAIKEKFDGWREWVEFMLCKCRKTGTPCSCPMYENPRKWFKEKTIQERKNGA